MSRRETILITGATGTVGAYLSLYLKEKGYNVIASGLRENDNGFFKDNSIRYISVDVSKASDFDKLEGLHVDTVVHMGGSMPATMEGYHPDRYVESIVMGTLNTLEYMRREKVLKIIFGQSRADSNYLMNQARPIPSDIEKRYPETGDHSIYTICKNAAVDMINHYHYQYGIKRFILRLPTIYAYHPNPYFYVDGIKKPIAYKLLIDKAIRGEPIEVWGNPGRAKEITYVKDLLQIIERSILSNRSGGMYNVGRGVGVTLDEQIKGIIKVFSSEKQSNLIYRPDKPDARQFVHDISKTKQELGYEPQYDYMAMLQDMKVEMNVNRFEKLWGKNE